MIHLQLTEPRRETCREVVELTRDRGKACVRIHLKLKPQTCSIYGNKPKKFKKMEQNIADLLTDAFSDTSLLSFPEGDLDFEPLNFEEDKQALSHGRLPVLTEEEENLDEDEEKENKEPSCENENVPGHISQQTYVRLTEEFTQHIKEQEEEEEEEKEDEEGEEDEGEEEEDEEEEDEEGEEEEGEEEEEEEEEDEEMVADEPGSPTEAVHDHFSTETCDISMTDEDEDNEEESEEEEEEEMNSEEDPGIENPNGWSVVGHYNEDGCESGEEHIENVVAIGRPLAEKNVENHATENEDHEACENSDVRCFEGVTEDVTMVTTERQPAEDHNDLSSDSDLEVIRSPTKDNPGEEGCNVDLHVPQETEEEEQDEGDRSQEVFHGVTDPAALAELLDEDKMKDFLGDDHQGAGESFFDYPSDFPPCDYDKDGGEKQSQPRSVMPGPPEPKVERNIHSERTKTEEQGKHVERHRCEKEDADEEKHEEEAVAAMPLGVKGDQDFAHCAICKSDTNSSMARISAGHLKPGSSSESYSNNSSDTTSDSSSDSTSDSSSEEKVEPNEINERHSLGPQHHFQDHREAEEDSSKQRVAKLHPPEIISKVPALTCHNEAEPSCTSLNTSKGAGNISSSDSEESWMLDAEQREDKQETWLGIEAESGVSVHSYLLEQLEVAGGLESHVSPDISLDTREENHCVVLDNKHEASATTDSGEEEFADEEEDDEEDERNWEQEKLRIDAFYKFYDDSEGSGGVATGTGSVSSERKTRVQFCMDPLPQVIQYTDSDMDISTDGEMDLDSKARLEGQSVPGSLRRSSPVGQETQEAKAEQQDQRLMAQTHRKRDRCLTVLKIICTMTVVILMGLAMFWWTTDQLDWDW
ncbi:histone acetyltransferase KAT6B-like isoform X2 [Esox lucius]|uniref:histone acetyltransferase KAT6B-like isoform X2 n=1 Tax=Esox lucius TaxID=8010 RepID=UPI001476B5E3|nr:histone acetyltransferase KAT6B-like isoform X2 [Esox lucius]